MEIPLHINEDYYQPHKDAVLVSCADDVIKAETRFDDNCIFTRVVLEGKIALFIYL